MQAPSKLRQLGDEDLNANLRYLERKLDAVAGVLSRLVTPVFFAEEGGGMSDAADDRVRVCSDLRQELGQVAEMAP
jgi:hypothetical protein